MDLPLYGIAIDKTGTLYTTIENSIIKIPEKGI